MGDFIHPRLHWWALKGHDFPVAAACSELDCKFADFAANVEMLHDPATLRADRADLRRRVIQDAEAAAGALQQISAWCA